MLENLGNIVTYNFGIIGEGLMGGPLYYLIFMIVLISLIFWQRDKIIRFNDKIKNKTGKDIREYGDYIGYNQMDRYFNNKEEVLNFNMETGEIKYEGNKSKK